MEKKECLKGIPIKSIGTSISCETCLNLVRDGYCNELKSYRIEETEKEIDYPVYCYQCQKFKDEIPLLWSIRGYEGFCKQRKIYLKRYSCSCMNKGVLIVG